LADDREERELLRVLSGLAGSARIFRLQLDEAAPYVDRLSEDYGPAAELAVALMIARSDQRGSVANIDHLTVGIMKDLRP
jgi:hypothetical protein